MYAFLDLNNRGVRLLDEGEFDKAAELFRESFNAMKQMIESNNSHETSVTSTEANNLARTPTPTTTDKEGSTKSTRSNMFDGDESDASHVSGLEETATAGAGGSNARRRRRTRTSRGRRTRSSASPTGEHARTPTASATLGSASSPSVMDNNSPRTDTSPAETDEVNFQSSATYSNRTSSKRKKRNDGCSTDSDNNNNNSKPLTTAKRRRSNTAGDFVSVTSLFSDESDAPSEQQLGPMGRPLWLQTPKRKGGNTLSILASSILYNFAYALHRMGTKASLTDEYAKKNHYLQQALNIYGVAMRVSVKGRSPVVLWLCCHNLQHLLVQCFARATGDDAARYIQKYRKLETHKANILRSLSGGRPNSNHTCLMVLAMLGLGGSENPESPAAAA